MIVSGTMDYAEGLGLGLFCTHCGDIIAVGRWDSSRSEWVDSDDEPIIADLTRCPGCDSKVRLPETAEVEVWIAERTE